jgi:ATP-dependent DNA ligase
MLCRSASLSRAFPSGESWPHQIKWGGFRVIARKTGERTGADLRRLGYRTAREID